MDKFEESIEKNEMKKIDIRTKYIVLYLFLIISGSLICFNYYIGYDEAYSMCLIRHSYADIIRITSQDVHPPLYYLLLKTFILPFSDSILAARIFSLLIYIAFVSLGPLMVSKIFNQKTGFFFSFFAVTLPACQSYLYSEIRMYGLAVFFVTSCVLFAIYIDKNMNSPNTEKWFGLFITGILSAYTQYYALIAVAFIYLVLFIRVLHRKAFFANIKSILLCMIGSVILYVPWLLILIKQLTTVSEGYWIESYTLHTYLSFIAFPAYCSIHVAASFLYLLVIFILFLAGIFRRRNNLCIDVKTSLYHRRDIQVSVCFCLIPYIAVILTGCIVSWVIRPLFSARYIKCILGLIIICMADLFSNMKKEIGRRVLIIFCLFFAVANFGAILVKNLQNNKTYQEYTAYLNEKMSDNKILAGEQSHVLGITAFYNKCGMIYLPEEKYTADLEAFYPVLLPIEDIGELTDQDKVWLMEGSELDKLLDNSSLGYSVTEESTMFIFYDQTDEIPIKYSHVMLYGTAGDD